MHLLDTVPEDKKRREWVWERIGWGVMLLVVVLTGTGVFGGGPVAWEETTVTREWGRFTMSYDSWNRYASASELHLVVEAPQVEGDTLRVAFGPGLGTGLKLEGEAPPGEGSFDAEGFVYSFPVEDWSRPKVVAFEYQPARIGSWSDEVVVTAGNETPVRLPLVQRIFP